MIEVVLLTLVMYTTPDGRSYSQWQEVKNSFTTMTECYNFVNSVNKPYSPERLTCIQRRV